MTKEKQWIRIGLRGILRRVLWILSLLGKSFRQAKKTDMLSIAGALSFTTILSLTPILAVCFWGFKVFGGLDYAYQKLLPYILGFLSEGTGEAVRGHLQLFIKRVHTSAIGGIGIFFLFLTATTTYLTVSKSFLKIWEFNARIPLKSRLKRASLVLTLGPMLLLFSILATTALASVATSIRLPHSGILVAVFLNTLLYVMIYSLVPMVKIPAKIIFIGSLLPAFSLELAKISYAFYAKRMVSYSIFYGSFAAIPLFLIWIYIAWCITLFGGIWIRTLQIELK